MRIPSLALAALAALSLTAATASAHADTHAPHAAPDHAAAAATSIDGLEITGGFARASLPGAPTVGAYVTITNHGSAADTLTGVTSPAAARVSLHTMSMKGDVMEMREVPGGIEIPAGETVAMAPSGLHLMLERPTARLVEGEKIILTLTFAKAGAVDVTLPVLGIAAKSAEPDHAGHAMEKSK